ncbi:hypothetical protein LCGC14_0341050 [marine sediment metagenome]|uniref:DegT/DnrJ/EryC1/StrS aminotransferase n=1 Tax=marine sediment metagenome TaxID=412755 RepID=A0A0F9WL93_9ZZZZ
MSITKVEFFKHNIGEKDIARASEVMRQPFLSSGKVVEEFEDMLAEYLGVKYVVAVSSCTAALHLSLLSLGMGKGKRVLTTPMTFMATSNAILYTGAMPVFVDVDRDTGLIDLSKLSLEVDVVLPVHLYGQMCDMERIDKMGFMPWVVLEDAAHSLMVGIGERSEGACISFYPTKEITSGEGGVFATNNIPMAEMVRSRRNHGMTKDAHSRYEKPYQHWDMEMLGYNFRMSNIQAALLLGQLDRIDELKNRRALIWDVYASAFRRNTKIGLIKTDSSSAKLMFTILVENRDKVLNELQERGVGVAVNYRAVHLLDYYRKRFGYKEGDFPNAEYIGNHTITLPLYPKLTQLEIEYVIEKVNEVVK